MEAKLKKELEATKSALKLQTLRCRQLVAAFTRKLQEKEIELRASKDLRDQQLSRLLRALLILESRLKKEQKIIRQQLQDKDLIIERQEKEISKLRLEANSKWMSRESLVSESSKDNESHQQSHNWNLTDVKHPQTTGEERLDNLCRGIMETSFRANPPDVNDFESSNKISYADSESKKNEFKDNPVLESVNQILLKDEEDLLKSVKPIIINNGKVGEAADGVVGGSEWYETDSSLVVVPEERTETGAWCISVVEEEEIHNDKNKVWGVEKTSPTKSQLLEEKVVLEMSKKNLTIAQQCEDLDEINSVSGKSEASYQELVPVLNKSKTYPVKNLQKPPALPPKPARLLKPYQILQREPPPEVKTNIDNKKLPTNTRHHHPVPAVRYNIQDVKRPQMNGHAKPQEINFAKKKDDAIPTNCSAIRIGSSVSSLITGSSRDTIVTELNAEQNVQNNVPDDTLPHVSQLVRQFEVLGKPTTPEPDDELRKNFEEFKLEESYADDDGRHDGDGAENIINHYATLSIVPPPLPKEPPPVQEMNNKMYETFLETTGLSQKSILTPSRMLSNHRSCLKPKDVKHRSRIKAAAVIEKCNNVSNVGGSTVKYWTEPFL